MIFGLHTKCTLCLSDVFSEILYLCTVKYKINKYEFITILASLGPDSGDGNSYIYLLAIQIDEKE